MELQLKRSFFTSTTTIGELSINNTPFCFILEDTDRGLTSTSSISNKIHSKTAIPYGRYEIVLTFSDRFQKVLPLLLHVPLYAGIRIHPGNRSTDTDGCLLPGKWDGKTEMVTESRITFGKLFTILKAAWSKEKIFITVSK